MSRTVRNHNPKSERYAFAYDERKRHMFLKGAKSFRSFRCSDAQVDGDGSAKLDTRSTTACKVGAIAGRKMRRVARLHIARQLEDA